jgi:hypothetical protein
MAPSGFNANSGLRKEKSIGNGRLFGFHGIGNESRKDVNQEINRRSINGVNLRKRLCVKFLSKIFTIKLSKELKKKRCCFYEKV